MRDLAAGGIEFESEALLISAGHQSGARRTARCCGDISVGQPCATVGQSVDVWSRDRLRAIDAGVAIAEVVGQDQHNVGWTLFAAGNVVDGIEQATSSFFRRGIRREDGLARSLTVPGPFRGGAGASSGSPALRPSSRLGDRNPSVRIGIHPFEQGWVLELFRAEPPVPVLVQIAELAASRRLSVAWSFLCKKGGRQEQGQAEQRPISCSRELIPFLLQAHFGVASQ